MPNMCFASYDGKIRNATQTRPAAGFEKMYLKILILTILCLSISPTFQPFKLNIDKIFTHPQAIKTLHVICFCAIISII